MNRQRLGGGALRLRRSRHGHPPHPYLVGRCEGRSLLDAVCAARDLAVLRRIRQNSVERITPTSRVMLLQGLADTTVVAPSTTPLGTTYQAAGVNLVFRTYPRSTHASVALDGAADATRFLARVLATR